MRAVIERALRRIGVTAVDEPAQPADYAQARETLESLVAELATPWGIGRFSWTIDDVPAAIRSPLAYLLAVRLAPDYGVAEPEPEKTALIRLRSVSVAWPPDPETDEEEAEAERLAEEAERARWF